MYSWFAIFSTIFAMPTPPVIHSRKMKHISLKKKKKKLRTWNILLCSNDFYLNHAKLESHIPKLIALMKMVRASMKMIIDALPRSAIIFLTTCWPVKAAIVATKTKYAAAAKSKLRYQIVLNWNEFDARLVITRVSMSFFFSVWKTCSTSQN